MPSLSIYTHNPFSLLLRSQPPRCVSAVRKGSKVMAHTAPQGWKSPVWTRACARARTHTHPHTHTHTLTHTHVHTHTHTCARTHAYTHARTHTHTHAHTHTVTPPDNLSNLRYLGVVGDRLFRHYTLQGCSIKRWRVRFSSQAVSFSPFLILFFSSQDVALRI